MFSFDKILTENDYSLNKENKNNFTVELIAISKIIESLEDVEDNEFSLWTCSYDLVENKIAGCHIKLKKDACLNKLMMELYQNLIGIDIKLTDINIHDNFKSITLCFYKKYFQQNNNLGHN